MRVFVTGGTGGIGSAVVPELIGAGHEVLCLTRSPASAQAARAMGATDFSGDIDDPGSLRAGAAQSDGVVYLAFGHDFNNFEQMSAQEGCAVATLGAALEGSGKPLVVASGTPAIPGHVATEEDPLPAEGTIGGRARTARAVLDLAAKDVRSAVVRLPRSVHRQGGPFGFASLLIAAAQATGVSGYVGDGSQRWPAVHVLDAARLFRLALEGATPGTVAHAVADEGDPMRAIAEAIGRQLNLPVRSVPAEDFGVLGHLFGVDQPASSALTREQFDWRPTHPSLLDDLNDGGYAA
ncbi:SDR family oxidoreductase [Mycobacterium parmense]|uniref:3-beta hydroxysteroid dehydrogenase n=1 Tax=Mycobacterium parmense TaxID=185642 RepID=A0A7I7YRV3_9MYCO|nr:SDR family oxidoreductase [Mycobacterium parmense]MCV7349666.1 SDR family oxidoreductase [Mycobacterium parmense]ORW51874.1 3-beta hydroxysteroid dehydrogenase [Mycobacterium parmense]BBZ43683.1 3-beta hydroxysteroid dehydrogenase [Mycobacterium parmense]